MSFQEFLVKVVAQLLVHLTVRMIEVLANSEYAQNVVHAIHERCSERGSWAALRSAVRSLFHALDPSPGLSAALVHVATTLGCVIVFSQILPRITSTIPFPALLQPGQTIISAVGWFFSIMLILNAALLVAAFAERLVICFDRHNLRVAVRGAAIAAAAGIAAMILHSLQPPTAAPVAGAHAQPESAVGTTIGIMFWLGMFFAMVRMRIGLVLRPRKDWPESIADAYVGRLEV